MELGEHRTLQKDNGEEIKDLIDDKAKLVLLEADSGT